MMNGQPVLLGEVLYDCFEEDGSRTLGGAPFNVAWHLQGFGQNPVFISRVGDDDAGRNIRASMQQWGMDLSGLQLDTFHPTGEVSIRLKGGQPSFDILGNQAYDHIDANTIPSLEPSLIYHGSLALRSPATYSALQSLLGKYHCPVFFDVNLRAPWWDRHTVLSLLDHTHWLKINDEELQILVTGPGELEHKAQQMQNRHGIELMIVTQGSAGAFSLAGNGELHRVRPTDNTRVVDTVGAGDAFAAVCILGLINQWDIATTLERAQSFASLIVGNRGATLNDANDYKRLRASW